MIGCSANRDRDGIKLPEDSAEIGMNVEAHCACKERRATGRGENNVDEETGIGMSHSYAPPGLWIQVSTLIPQAHAWGYRLVPATQAGWFGARVRRSERRAKAGSSPNQRTPRIPALVNPANPASSANPAAFPLSRPCLSNQARHHRLKSFFF
jgi:hypothetical protein